MLRWSLWSDEHRAKLSHEQRRRVLVKWLLAGGVATTIQVAVLAILMLLVPSAGVVVLLDVAGFPWFTGLIIVALIALDVLLLHQALVRYIASELAETIDRQGLLRGPPICPRCGYDLRGNPQGICPECGHARPD